MRLLFLATLLLYLPFSQACDRSYKVSIDLWPPFFVSENKGNWAGLDVTILKAMIEGAGCRVEFVSIPPRRGLKYIAIGKIDIMMAASITKERKVYGYFTSAYRDELIGLMMPRGMPAIFPADALSDIFDQDVFISTQRGAWYGKEFENIVKNPIYVNKIHYANSESQAIDMLVRNRVDGVATDVIAGLYKAKNLGLDKEIEFHPYLLNRDKVSFYVSKKSVSEAEFEQLEVNLTRYLTSDSYKKLMAEYLPDVKFRSNN